MAHGRSTRICQRALQAILLVGTFACAPGLPGLDEPDAGEVGLDCDELCTLEDGCGLRGYDACVAQSCRGEARIPSDTDECMLVAEDCAEVALCTCAGSCARLDECTGSPDPGCEGTCETVLEQEPVETFQENRCRIESSCAALAACGGL